MTTRELPADARQIPEHPGYFCTPDGDVWSTKRGSPYRLSHWKGQHGYIKVTLHCECWQVPNAPHSVHRLVLMTFDRMPKEDELARHLNGKPTDNRLENLLWGTPKENGRDRRRHGTVLGEDNPNAKLTWNDVAAIRRRYGLGGVTQSALGHEYGVARSTISQIISGQRWRER